MKCPCCGADVPEDALSCPRCHAAIDVTRKISLNDASWCPSCGALVAPGATSCPKCGSALGEEEPVRPTRDLDLPEIGPARQGPAPDAERTGVMTRIESAIPPADDADSPSARRDRYPRTRTFALAALLAVVVVGGAVLLITHPWDPFALQTRATEPADTSMSGYPGALDSLSGQDARPDATSDGDDAQGGDADELASAYESLVGLSERADESEASLRGDALAAGSDVREAGLADARAISVEVSNLIASVQGTTGQGADDTEAEHLLTLGSWLRNRCDALTEAWEACASALDPSAQRDAILSPLDAAADYARLFEENVEAWRPSSSS